jgi:hypothetical protein
VFGTWFNEDRRPPAVIGIPEAMPPRFRDQIVWPFRQIGRRTPPTEEAPGEVASA